MNAPLCYYGSPEPLPPPRELRAGPLSLVYEAGDLRYVRLGESEVLRRVYVAVRDRNWGTVPARLTNEQIEAAPDRFLITYDSEHRQLDVHFRWRARIEGAGDGTLRFLMDGEGLSTFQRNRIGFCVLHPVRECAGARCRLEHGDGAVEENKFPRFIAPQNPFRELKGISHEVSPGLWAELQFEGDLFETEDQRNWTDASFKTFCTPLRLPFPVTVEPGSRVRQAITLRLRGPVPATAAPAPPATFTVRAQPAGALPWLGVSVAGHGMPLTPRETKWLRRLRPAHLRVDIDLAATDAEPRLRRAAAEAVALGTGLELAALFADAVEDDATKLLSLLRSVNPPLRRVLLFHNKEWATPERILEPGVNAIARASPATPVFAGSRVNFTELNRCRPPTNAIRGVCYCAQPQEHTFDNASLVECCATLADTVRSAREFCGDLPLAVTPITFRKQVNPYATGPALPVGPGELPSAVDRRQMSLFGAGWTLAALKYLAESAADSATFYETTGWLGVMERAEGSPLPDQFPSKPGMLFPLYHVLADATEFAGAPVLPYVSAYPLRFDGLALRQGEKMRVLLANLTDREQDILVRGLPGEMAVRTLDEGNFERATGSAASGFRDEPGERCPAPEGALRLRLRPYAYVRIDTI
jgi:hypothetical protein